MSSGLRWMSVEFRQMWVSLPVLLTKLGMGMSMGFTSCFLKAISEPTSDIQMDIHTSTWFVSLVAISLTFGHTLASLLITRFGRQKSAVITSLPAIIGQIITYFARDVPALMIGRVLNGISCGGNSLIGSVIIGEYVSPKNRGMYLNLATALLNVGSLIVHAVGYYTSWRTLVIINVVPFILCFIAAYTSPESPSWLAERKQYERSREAFYWLRGRTEDSSKEIEELIRAQRHKTVDRTFTENATDFFLKFKKKNFLKPLFICIIAFILVETSGRHVFPSYAAQLITEIMSAGVDIYYYHIALDMLIIASGLTASYLVRLLKTRTLLLSTGAATAAVLALACVSLYLVKSGLIPEDYSMLSLVLFGLFVILGNLGCACVPFVLGGELLPLEHKAVASLIYYASGGMLMFGLLKVMPYMVSAFHIYGAFLVLAVCMCLTLILLYYILPETSNKTLQEIEEYFEEGILRDRNEESGGDEQESLHTLKH